MGVQIGAVRYLTRAVRYLTRAVRYLVCAVRYLIGAVRYLIGAVRYLMWSCGRFLMGLGTSLLHRELFISMSNKSWPQLSYQHYYPQKGITPTHRLGQLFIALQLGGPL